MTARLYRLEVTYPEHAFDEGWSPEGWTASEWYVERLETSAFVWPSARAVYRSRSSAADRAALLRKFGAEVRIRRTLPIVWEVTEEDVLRDRIADLEAELEEMRVAS